jgi:hypothetical protein
LADDAMPPRRGHPLGATGFHGITARPYGTFAAYIFAVGQRVWIGTFCIADEAARTYDATAWTFGRIRSELNFLDVESLEEVNFLAPPPDSNVRVSTRP